MALSAFDVGRHHRTEQPHRPDQAHAHRVNLLQFEEVGAAPRTDMSLRTTMS